MSVKEFVAQLELSCECPAWTSGLFLPRIRRIERVALDEVFIPQRRRVRVCVCCNNLSPVTNYVIDYKLTRLRGGRRCVYATG